MMNWDQLLNTTRLGHRAAKQEPGRSPFNSDHDKVIFSGSFRRLARKTQVHPLATNDHVHNRLTHSLEVACVGRTLGMRVGEKLISEQRIHPSFTPTDLGDIVQTACLAHDIGNPPFGHTGEEAIRHWFTHDAGSELIARLGIEEACDLRNFEGNAQGFRVLTTSEYHAYDDGMRLTYASLGSFVKYPWMSLAAVDGERPKRNKYGVYRAEQALFEEVAQATGLLQRGPQWYCRHPLVHLMEIADDFCYALLDLEDGIEMGILDWEEVFSLLEPVLDTSRVQELKQDMHRLRPGRRPPLIRGKVISEFVDAAAEAFIRNETAILAGQHDELLGLCDHRVRDCVIAAKELAKRKVFQHPRKIEMEIGAYNTIATVLDVSCHAALNYIHDNDMSDYKSRRVIDLIGKDSFGPAARPGDDQPWSRDYLTLMRALDFVSGMTDNYAMHLARQFKGFGSMT